MHLLSVTSAALFSTGDLYPGLDFCLQLPNGESYRENRLTRRWNLKWHLPLGARRIVLYGVSGFLLGSDPHIAGSFFTLLPSPLNSRFSDIHFFHGSFQFPLNETRGCWEFDWHLVCTACIHLPEKGHCTRKDCQWQLGWHFWELSSIPSSSVPHPSGRKCHWQTSGWRAAWLLQ